MYYTIIVTEKHHFSILKVKKYWYIDDDMLFPSQVRKRKHGRSIFSMQTKVGDIDVKLDRISIVGWIKGDNEEIEKIMDELNWEVQPELKADAPWFKLERHVGGDVYETVAVLVRNQFHNSWRIDTSNHLNNKDEKDSIKRVILMMQHRHITRVDIAFDYKNCKYSGMKHTIIKPNVTTRDYMRARYHSKIGKLETLYVGKRRSLAMYRYYDKLVEQHRANKPVDQSVKNWERLEIQLRGKKTSDWVKEAENMLYYFKCPSFKIIPPISDDDPDRKKKEKEANKEANYQAKMLIMIEHPEIFAHFSENTRRKYRNYYKDNKEMNNEYAKESLRVLKEKISSINDEIEDFMQTMTRK